MTVLMERCVCCLFVCIGGRRWEGGGGREEVGGEGYGNNIRIAGNFRGRKLSRIGENTIFAEKTFADCSLFAAPKDATPQISQRKVSRIATKP